jgi:hypothetical protein
VIATRSDHARLCGGVLLLSCATCTRVLQLHTIRMSFTAQPMRGTYSRNGALAQVGLWLRPCVRPYVAFGPLCRPYKYCGGRVWLCVVQLRAAWHRAEVRAGRAERLCRNLNKCLKGMCDVISGNAAARARSARASG